MPDEVVKPIEVSANEAGLDLFQALGRYITVILTSVPVVLALVGKRDINEFIAYLQSNEFAVLASALVSLGTLGYGLFKTHKRGAQVVSVAGDSAVPDRIARLK